MRASRTSRRAGVACILVCLGVGASLFCRAASAAAPAIGPPIPLVPSSPEAAPATPPGGIAGAPLTPPPAGWNGDTKPAGAPLPASFWQGTPRSLADMLLARMPDTTVPALQALERRLLLSPGTPPSGADAPGLPGGLPLLRAAALLRLGEIDGARAVIDALPGEERAAAQPLAVEADAIAGQLDQACDIVGRVIQQNAAVFWQRSLIACQALHGDTAKADLGLQLLAEEKDGQDDALARAVDAIAGRPAPPVIERLGNPDPLLLRLLAAAQLRLSPALAATLRPDLALTWALDGKASAEARIAAAERAAAFGALPVARLRTLYADVAASADVATAESGPLARAQRFVDIQKVGDPAERLARIIGFAESFPSDDGGGLFVAARLLAPALAAIIPDVSLAGSAAGAGRLLLAAGDDDGARRWLALAPGGAPRLRQVLALSDGHLDAGEVAAPAPEPMLFALRVALGAAVPPSEWSRLPPALWNSPGPASPPLAASLDLTDAVAAKRIGESVLAAVMVAAPQGGSAENPLAVSAAVRALTAIGLADDARRLAVEAALAR